MCPLSNGKLRSNVSADARKGYYEVSDASRHLVPGQKAKMQSLIATEPPIFLGADQLQ